MHTDASSKGQPFRATEDPFFGIATANRQNGDPYRFLETLGGLRGSLSEICRATKDPFCGVATASRQKGDPYHFLETLQALRSSLSEICKGWDASNGLKHLSPQETSRKLASYHL